MNETGYWRIRELMFFAEIEIMRRHGLYTLVSSHES
jgi:hypothetical protein